MGVMENLKKLAGKHPDKAEEGIDKASETVDSKTGGKYSDKLSSASDKAKERLDTGSKDSGKGDGKDSGKEDKK